MSTFRDVAKASLRLLGVIQPGEVPSAEELNDALEAAQRLEGRWQAENLYLFTVTRSTWTIVSGTQEYLVGTGQAVNITRPMTIEHINYQDTSFDPDIEYQLQPLTDDAWSKTVQKALTNTYPSAAYYNPTYPYGTITLWPIPTSATLQGVIYYKASLASIATVDTTISFPPGYEELLTTHLAIEIAPEYQAIIHPALAERAQKIMEVVKRANVRIMDMAFSADAIIQGRDRYGWWIWSGP